MPLDIPHGVIMMWRGTIPSIPPGWYLCDGTHGTPDLTDRFVLGAGVTYNPGDTGGGVAHSHTFTGDGHIHAIPAGVGMATGTVWKNETNSAPATGQTDLEGHLPPYYALAFIMKL